MVLASTRWLFNFLFTATAFIARPAFVHATAQRATCASLCTLNEAPHQKLPVPNNNNNCYIATTSLLHRHRRYTKRYLSKMASPLNLLSLANFQPLGKPFQTPRHAPRCPNLLPHATDYAAPITRPALRVLRHTPLGALHAAHHTPRSSWYQLYPTRLAVCCSHLAGLRHAVGDPDAG